MAAISKLDGQQAGAGAASTEAEGPQDSELVRRAQSGDLDAFNELVQRHQERVYGTIYHMTSNHEDANDLTQEVFLKAWQALPDFRGNSSFFTWLYRIAINRSLNFLKQRGRHYHLSLNDMDAGTDHAPDMLALVSDQTPHREVNLAELQEKLNEAMLKLSETHRTVVVLHDIQGMSHEEIGKITGCNTGTVRSRLFYARQQLQAHLSSYLQ